MLLRLTVILSFIAGVMGPLTVLIPFPWGITIDGTSFSRIELWQTGLVFPLLAYGPIDLAIPYGVVRRTSWVRPFLICLPLVQILPFEVFQLVFGTTGLKISLYQWFPITLGFAIFLAIYTVGAVTYLYFNDSVRSYFRS